MAGETLNLRQAHAEKWRKRKVKNCHCGINCNTTLWGEGAYSLVTVKDEITYRHHISFVYSSLVLYSLQYFTGLLDITLMSWISLNDSHVLFNLFVSRENQATTVIVALQTVMTLWQSLLAVKFSATCHQMATLAFRLHKIQFRPGLRPDPAGGAYDAPPDTLVGWGGGYPLPIPSTPSASRCRRLRRRGLVPSAPRYHNFWNVVAPLRESPPAFSNYFKHCSLGTLFQTVDLADYSLIFLHSALTVTGSSQWATMCLCL